MIYPLPKTKLNENTVFKILALAVTLSCFMTTSTAQDTGFKFNDQLNEKQIELTYNGRVLTAYYYADSVKKPILFPINTVSGITVTRGFPIAPRAGERMDHPHHAGMWLNYESVNGLDFWNNSTAIPFKNRPRYGTIVHDGVVKTVADKTSATLEVTARWINHSKQILLRESTRYTFKVEGDKFIIDRKTALTALYEDVVFKDVKDGLLGFRVARELEQPSAEPGMFVDEKGNGTPAPLVPNDSLTGEYLSSAGLIGDAVWGTRGNWASLRGEKDGKEISITIIDHPKNPGYPTYWHARGYGLFSANPLGQAIFSKGKENLNLILKKDDTVMFRFRVVIHEGNELTTSAIEALIKDFMTVE
jgi:hypothetical protein